MGWRGGASTQPSITGGKVEYRRGDILDRKSVEELVGGADVVVHLAFVIVAGRGESREINLTGSRNVFEAAAAPAPSASSTPPRSPPTASAATCPSC